LPAYKPADNGFIPKHPAYQELFMHILLSIFYTNKKNPAPALEKSNIKKIRPAAGQIATGLIDMALSPNTVSSCL